MKVFEKIVRRATGIPHPFYLEDPVIGRYYQRSCKQVPFSLLGFFVCLSSSIGLSLGMNLTGGQLFFPLLTLFSLMSLLLMRIHFMLPRKELDMSFLREVLNDETLDQDVIHQLRYIVINKVGNVSLDDLYRLFEFNNQNRMLRSGIWQVTGE